MSQSSLQDGILDVIRRLQHLEAVGRAFLNLKDRTFARAVAHP